MPDTYISPEGTGKLLWLTKTIHEWLLRSFHPLVQNAVQKLKKVKKYITGLLPEKYFAWNVAKFHIASSGHQQPMKMLIMDMVHVHTKNSRGFFAPFLVALKRSGFPELTEKFLLHSNSVQRYWSPVGKVKGLGFWDGLIRNNASRSVTLAFRSLRLSKCEEGQTDIRPWQESVRLNDFYP